MEDKMDITSMTRRTALERGAKGALALLTVSIAARSLGLPALAQVPQKFVIGSQPINPVICSYIGMVDFFKEEGLNAEITRFQSGPAINQAIAAGNVAVGDVGIAPAVVAITRGLPVIVPYLGAYCTPTHPLERIMVREDSSIRSLDDLKGKKLAMFGRGTVTDLMLGALPKKSKIRKEDLELVLIPQGSQPAALRQGLVDAIFAVPPADTVAERQFKTRTIANGTDLVPYVGLGTVVVRRDFADAYPDATKKLFRACIRLARWIQDNEVLARRVAAKNLDLPDELATQTRIPLFARNGLPVMPNVWHAYEMLVKAKTIDPHPDPANLINNAVVEPAKRFVLPALEELGEQKDPQIEAMLKGEYPLLPKPAASYYADWEHRLVKA
jgi:ABC-type nitrate/sulfonate/bicarbonate transport system substrate-binding protein